MYLMAKLFRRRILKTLKFIKTKTLCANYRKIALTIRWLEGITNTWKKKAFRTPTTPGKRPWHLPPPKKKDLVTPLARH